MTRKKQGPQYVTTVREMNIFNLHCHVLRHMWQEGPVLEEVHDGVRLWVSREVCSCCGKTRTDHMEPETFELLWRTYSEVDGFKTVEPTTFQEYRAEFIRRRLARTS